jgi:PAS domain S-box-containing protein
MQTSFKVNNIFKSPEFQDEEQNRIAKIINTISIAALFGFCLFLLQHLIVIITWKIFPIIGSLILTVLSIILLRKRLLNWSGKILFWTIYVFFCFQIFMHNGTHDSVILAFPGLYIYAGLIFNKKYYSAISIISFVTIIIIGELEINGVIKNAYSGFTSLKELADRIAMLLVMSIFISYLTSILLKILFKYYDREKDLNYETELLKSSEQKFKKVVETIPSGILLIDKEGKVNFANPASEIILGKKREKMTKLFYNDVEWNITSIDGNPLPEDNFPFVKVQKSLEPLFNEELSIQHQNGERIILSINAAPYIDSEGTFNGMVASLENITERKKTDEIIRKSEHRLRNIIENAPFGAHLYKYQENGELIFIGANKAADKILKIDHNQFINKTIEEAFPALINTPVPEKYKQVAREGIYYEDDQITYNEKGINGAYEIHAFQTDKNRMTVFFHDITEHKKREEALKSSEKKFSLAFQSSPIAISITRLTDGRILEANENLSLIFGYSKDEFIGKTTNELRIWGIAEESDLFIQELIEKGLVRNKEYVGNKKGGESIIILVNAEIIEIEDEKCVLTTILDISFQKYIENALLSSEERYKKLVDSVTDYIYSVKLKSGKPETTVHSQGCVAVTGYTSEDYANDPHLWIRMVYDDDKRAVFELGENILTGKDISALEHRIIHKNGSIKWVRNTPVPHFDKQGKITAYDGLITDITERKLAEEALRMSEERYRTLISTANEGIIIMDEKARINFVNSKLEKMFELSKEEIVGHKIDEFIFQEDLPDHQIKFNERRKGQLDTFERRLKIKNDKIIWVIISSSPIFDREKKFIGAFAMMTDITERKKTEEALLQSEERMRAIVEGTPHIFFYTQDSQANNIYVSPTVEKITGYKTDIWLNRKDWFITDAEFNNEARMKTQSHLRGEFSSDPVILEVRHAEGNPILLEAYEYPVIKEGKIIGLQGVAHDITERMKAEMELKVTNDKLNAIIEATPLPIFDLGLDGRIKEIWNPAAEKLLGWKKDEIIGKFLPSVTPENEEEFLQFRERIRTGKSLVGVEVVRQKKDGSPINYAIYGAPLHKADGSIYGNIVLLVDLTERQKNEEALRESEQLFRGFMDNMPSLVIIKDNDLRPIFFNKKYLETFPGDDWLGKTPYESFPTDIASVMEQNDRQALAEGFIIYEENWVDKENNESILETRKFKINRLGKAPLLGAIISDITDRKKAEVALIESEEKYRQLFEMESDALFLIEDKTGKILEANTSASRLYGYTHEELLQMRNVDLSAEPKETHRSGADQEETHIPVRYHKKKNGSIFPVEISAARLNWRGIPAHMPAIRDITERIRAEELLQSSENTLRLFINAMPEPSLLIDTKGNIIAANTAFNNEVNENPESILGKKYFDLLPLKIARARKQKIKEAIQNKIMISFEDSNEGQYYYNYINPITDDLNNISKIAIIGIDITKRKNADIELEKYRLHLEELIKERTIRLEEVNKLLQEEIVKQKEAEAKVKIALEKEKELSDLKSKFISIASHEFRTPLTTVLSSTELLERYGRSWEIETYKSQIERIKKSVKYLTNLMDEVLMISRSDSGKIKLDLKPIDVERLCKNLADDIKLIITDKHKLNFQISLSTKKMLFDEKLLKFIITNLLSNAAKYSPQGGEIGFIITEREKMLKIIISDEGIGIPDEDKIHLFDAFSRGTNVGEIYGTGLGMSIVKRSIDMLNGSIEFESILNIGSKFIVSLPVNH